MYQYFVYNFTHLLFKTDDLHFVVVDVLPFFKDSISINYSCNFFCNTKSSVTTLITTPQANITIDETLQICQQCRAVFSLDLPPYNNNKTIRKITLCYVQLPFATYPSHQFRRRRNTTTCLYNPEDPKDGATLNKSE